MDVEIVKFDHRNPMTRERSQRVFMREVFALLVSANDWAGDYQNLAGVLPGNLRKEGFLFGG